MSSDKGRMRDLADWAQAAFYAADSLFRFLSHLVDLHREFRECSERPLSNDAASHIGSLGIEWTRSINAFWELKGAPQLVREHFARLYVDAEPAVFFKLSGSSWFALVCELYRQIDPQQMNHSVKLLTDVDGHVGPREVVKAVETLDGHLRDVFTDELSEAVARLRGEPNDEFPRACVASMLAPFTLLGFSLEDVPYAWMKMRAGVEREAAKAREAFVAAAPSSTGGAPSSARGCSHGPNFEWVRWYGIEYMFRSPRQQAIVRVLWEAARKGDPWTSSETIGREIAQFDHLLPPKMSEAFKINGGRMHEAWGSLIEFDKRALYRLAANEAADLSD